ncbi:MAG: NADH:ubiquinone reductase (Na(+)-transporting) subunit D [Spirochaetales bacterium]|jgi:Na+-transporting NADH:ubiquinone oxidoreductase subunit D|nr:NADH:ubiquinone reductase (Na(+)-transporting) subunit D [Spirochaetales bacterium]
MARGQVKKTFLAPLGRDNPVFAQILGICSTLAVTNKLENTVVMTLGVMFTTMLSSFTLSLIRKFIPSRIRMMVETMVIATFVSIVDITLKAFLPDIWKQLGPYVGLIITNCIIMGRAEAFALNNKPGLSLIDGLASGMGYAYVLIVIAFVRELLGTGSIWGIQVLGNWWVNWTIMIMPPGAFFMLAIFIWVVKETFLTEKKEAK